MRRLLIAAIFLSFALSGCAAKAVPMVGAADGEVDLRDNSITQSKSGLSMTVRVRDFEYAPYRLVDNISAFEISIVNRGSDTVAVPLESFWLLDGEGHQYRPVSPEKVREIVRRDSPYLIPYPYVGYYYLEDAEKFSYFNTFTSSLPYYAENHPQDIFTEALPLGEPILPGAKVSGLLYIVVDLTTKDSVELRVYLPGSDVSAPPDFLFPFSIEK